MILPKPEDALHKAWLYRLLMALINEPTVSQQIFFKGDTCASMLNYLDKFSIDLDFDLKIKVNQPALRRRLHQLFKRQGLKLKDESQKALQFFLKYPSLPGKRNTLKLDMVDKVIRANIYQAQYLREIDRYMNCQTIETMFGHKLVAVTDRYKRNKTIAGRDIYDLHHFFIQGLSYNQAVIEERTKMKALDYLKKLVKFIESKITQTVIDQDLNILLPKKRFDYLRQKLKTETLMFIKDEIKRTV